ncbi:MULTISPECIES: di-heme oxidoredictase family protein [unclassified Xanthobacter]|uniref:di-heme oxidoredictase family protein n=1 Tax=unclassified Xanthobacter TaxID=2623496 RepID=UPI001F45126D|nr:MULTISPECIES: di-heme oxidoredictase family protein [unclassified Xanthobacter]
MARTKIHAALLATALACALPLVATPARALDDLDVHMGKALFKRPWTPAPTTTQADDGLGPLFDARSCASCHPASGRAAAAFDAKGQVEGRGMVLMIGQPDGAADPIYGRRLQIDAVPGLTAEGIIAADDTALPDGRRARKPRIDAPAYGPLSARSGLSLRVAPDLHGRGAMAAVSDATLLALEQEQAAGHDGISGKARRVPQADGSVRIGRFGWKASHPTIESQSAEAFFLDLGLSNPLHPEPWGDCTAAQAACRGAPHGAPYGAPTAAPGGAPGFEIGAAVLDRVVAYVASLPVPHGATPSGGEGARLFASVGCAACHRPELPTADGGKARLYSDLLLHDMGPDLGDTMPEPRAGASDWRTAPLMGISQAIGRDTGLLHDGRARSVSEAVGWHGGEAAPAAARFRALPDRERAALLDYVSSL